MRSAWCCWPPNRPLASSAAGVLVIDDTGDPTDHVARQYLGSVGKIDNGIVAVTTLWANEQLYYPLHVIPYKPERRLARGRQDPAFRTKPEIALSLVEQAQAVGITFSAIVADCFYGDHATHENGSHIAAIPFTNLKSARKVLWPSTLHCPVMNSTQDGKSASDLLKILNGQHVILLSIGKRKFPDYHH